MIIIHMHMLNKISMASNGIIILNLTNLSLNNYGYFELKNF
jgi:hypothetical protein